MLTLSEKKRSDFFEGSSINLECSITEIQTEFQEKRFVHIKNYLNPDEIKSMLQEVRICIDFVSIQNHFMSLQRVTQYIN